MDALNKALQVKGDCVECPERVTCDCSADEQCIITARSCWDCASFTCVDKQDDLATLNANLEAIKALSDPVENTLYLDWLKRSATPDLVGRAINMSDPNAGCVPCPDGPPPCNCKAGESCQLNARKCSDCGTVVCEKNNTSGGGGVNPGVIAGPIIAVVLILASLGLFWFLKRKKQRDLARLEDLAERARKGESSAFHLSTPASPTSAGHRSRHASQLMPHSPTSSSGQRTSSQLAALSADAEYRDEKGATIRVYKGKRGIINADPNHPDNGGNSDPFTDGHSVSTGGASSGHSANVIPIHFVPGSRSEDSLAKVLAAHGGPATPDEKAAAARNLDIARQNLMRIQQAGRMPPPRPARAPDLDLRLNPPRGGTSEEVGSSRDSIRSAFSAAPSFLSANTADLHLDVPQIVTSKQIHFGRLQAAEVVQLGRVAEGQSSPSDPFKEDDAPTQDAVGRTLVGKNADGTPVGASTTSLDGSFALSQPSPTDLRFSMGSLAYDRSSMSTVGTAYLQRAHIVNLEHPPPMPVVLPGAERPRFESVSSYQSTGGDSILGAFPMHIHQPGDGNRPTPGGVPTNSSTTTLDLGGAGRPPVAFKTPGPAGPAGTRPLTANSTHSLADSFLGTFPFVAPDVGGSGEGIPPTSKNPSRLTLGMSSASSGLGDFDFSFEEHGGPHGVPPPPLPVEDDDDGSTETDPTTPRAPTGPR
ncbi:hypothetical protein Q8F55_007521 [Vanrija albida]|uniref:Membrane anchor Opy2 N-terminal domain-containing protein n=1 Tax=Vanrija albida TaxID=181172 RepID=A0ABR3PUR1_9TREE